MAKYVVDDSTMTNIADPVRTLMGLTGGLTPANMKTQLDSANTAVTSQADLIAQITAALEGKAGGGSGEGGTSGTITPSSTSGLTITHGLGKVPNFFVLFLTSKSAASVTTKWKMSAAFISRYDGNIQAEVYSNGSASSQTLNVKDYDPTGSFSDSIFSYLNETTVKYTCNEGEFQAGQTYRWVAM